MLANIREILIVTNPWDSDLYVSLLGDGSKWGLDIRYAVQPSPDGIAQAFLIGKDFLDGCPCALVLGDNIFYGDGFGGLLESAAARQVGASVFAYWVQDPERFGVVEFDADHRPIGIVEKPINPRSNYAVTGLYFYDKDVCDIASQLKPSKRGELEITDLNRVYLDRGLLNVERMGRGYAWLDAGTHDALLEAGLFIQAVEKRQGLKIACPEEIAFRMKFISSEQVLTLAQELKSTAYADYLRRVVEIGPG